MKYSWCHEFSNVGALSGSSGTVFGKVDTFHFIVYLNGVSVS